MPVMPNKKGEGNIIRSVRITVGEKNTAIVNAKTPKSAYLTGDNHHVALYRKPDGKIIHQAVSLLEARMRLQRDESLVAREHQGYPLLCALFKGDMLERTDPDTGEVTYHRIDVLRSDTQMVIYPHTDASKKDKWQPGYSTFLKTGFKKIAVDPLGCIRG